MSWNETIMDYLKEKKKLRRAVIIHRKNSEDPKLYFAPVPPVHLKASLQLLSVRWFMDTNTCISSAFGSLTLIR